MDVGFDWVDCYMPENNCFYAEVTSFDYEQEWSNAMNDVKDKLNKQAKNAKAQKGKQEKKAPKKAKLIGQRTEKSIVYTGSPVKKVTVGYEVFLDN